MPGSTTLANYRALAGPMQEREVYAHLSRTEASPPSIPRPSAKTPLRWPGRLPARQAYMLPQFHMKSYGTIAPMAADIESDVSNDISVAESFTILKKRVTASPITLNIILFVSALAVLLSLVTILVLLFCLILKDVDYHDLPTCIAFGMLLVGSLVLLLFAAGFTAHFLDDWPFRTALKMAFEETLALLAFCGLVGLSMQAVGIFYSWTDLS